MSDEPVLLACARGFLLSCFVALTTALPSTADPPDKKVLQGYVREIPAQTKIPISFDWTIDSETTQDGDEFLAKTTENLTIDGHVVLPAGSVIKGKSSLVKPSMRAKGKTLIELKFETVTTPTNIQFPIVAHLVSHGGLLNVRRGRRDIAIHCTSYAPILVGRQIGGHSQPDKKWRHRDESLYIQHVPTIPLGVQPPSDVLFADKGKTFNLLTGDEFKIELAEALRVPQSP